jgi:murein DD-endopeptidase MepM/ murein hydrolase activator NlpD
LRFHHGVDVAAPAGTLIKAAQSGRVVFSGQLGEYGNTIILEHENGCRTLYGHAARNLVTAGEQVSEGQMIGMVGNTGRSTGPHLHFELQKEGERIDPATLGEAKLFALFK